MLADYLKAENLKFKHSLFRKLILLIPFVLIVISIVFLFIGIGLGGFSSAMVCNWCMPIASLYIMLLCHLVNKKEQVHKYQTIYSLPLDLKKTFLAKVMLIAANLLITSFILVIITIISECVLSSISDAIMHIGYYFLGYFLLWISLLWQIPFCLFLDQKVKFVGSIIINLFASAIGGLIISLTPLFWFFPYSWVAKFMIVAFGVLPNGLMVLNEARCILSLSESLKLILIALLTFVALSTLYAHWYKRQVYRK